MLYVQKDWWHLFRNATSFKTFINPKCEHNKFERDIRNPDLPAVPKRPCRIHISIPISSSSMRTMAAVKCALTWTKPNTARRFLDIFAGTIRYENISNTTVPPRDMYEYSSMFRNIVHSVDKNSFACPISELSCRILSRSHYKEIFTISFQNKKMLAK